MLRVSSFYPGTKFLSINIHFATYLLFIIQTRLWSINISLSNIVKMNSFRIKKLLLSSLIFCTQVVHSQNTYVSCVNDWGSSAGWKIPRQEQSWERCKDRRLLLIKCKSFYFLKDLLSFRAFVSYLYLANVWL